MFCAQNVKGFQRVLVVLLTLASAGLGLACAAPSGPSGVLGSPGEPPAATVGTAGMLGVGPSLDAEATSTTTAHAAAPTSISPPGQAAGAAVGVNRGAPTPARTPAGAFATPPSTIRGPAPAAQPPVAAAPTPAPAKGSAPGAPSSPQAPPAAAQTNTGAQSFAFASTNADGSPVRWNPCASIHFVTNLGEAPGSAAADVAQAVRMVADATGISFVNDGPTTEMPSANRPVDQPSRYPKGHSPVLIAWARRAETDIYNGEGPNAVGTAMATWIGAPSTSADQRAAYVTAQVAIEPDATRSFPAGFGSGQTIGLALLHELGHITGLAHVSDSSQVMYPDLMAVSSARYGAGDANGLHRLGTSAGCLPAR